MQAQRKIAVAGATGRVGRHVVDVLKAGGHEVVVISRSSGVDVVTGDGLAEALTGVACVIEVTNGPSSNQEAATEFFTVAARNLHEAGERAGVQRIIVVSIIGIDRGADSGDRRSERGKSRRQGETALRPRSSWPRARAAPSRPRTTPPNFALDATTARTVFRRMP